MEVSSSQVYTQSAQPESTMLVRRPEQISESQSADLWFSYPQGDEAISHTSDMDLLLSSAFGKMPWESILFRMPRGAPSRIHIGRLESGSPQAAL